MERATGNKIYDDAKLVLTRVKAVETDGSGEPRDFEGEQMDKVLSSMGWSVREAFYSGKSRKGRDIVHSLSQNAFTQTHGPRELNWYGTQEVTYESKENLVLRV